MREDIKGLVLNVPVEAKKVGSKHVTLPREDLQETLNLMLHHPESFNRVVCRFSCGAASACASKLAIDRYGERQPNRREDRDD